MGAEPCHLLWGSGGRQQKSNMWLKIFFLVSLSMFLRMRPCSCPPAPFIWAYFCIFKCLYTAVLLQPLTQIYWGNSVKIKRNVKLKHKPGQPRVWEQQQARLPVVCNGALITIAWLYTAASSIREFPVSPCQHVHPHKYINHRKHMLTPTSVISDSSLRRG